MRFSSLELRDMIKIYYSCHRNSQIASQQYMEFYPERPQPHYSYFATLDSNLALYGSFHKPRRKYGSRVTAEEEQQIINEVNLIFIIFVSFPTTYFYLRLPTIPENQLGNLLENSTNPGNVYKILYVLMVTNHSKYMLVKHSGQETMKGVWSSVTGWFKK